MYMVLLTYLDYTCECREGKKDKEALLNVAYLNFNICGRHYSLYMNRATCFHGATDIDYTCECREGKVLIFVWNTAVLA